MTCYFPVKLYESDIGKRFRKGISTRDLPTVQEVPCGCCTGCKLDFARDWALRCYHEALMHEEKCFLTLTYAPKYLPEKGSVSKEEMQLFMKRLRAAVAYPGVMPSYDDAMRIKYYKRDSYKNEPVFRKGDVRTELANKEVSFYGCGEYGSGPGRRPHYHILVFGFSPTDKKLYKNGIERTGRLRLRDSRRFSSYTSKFIEKIWKKGFITVGEVTMESAGYVARYCTKKITGIKARKYYNGREPEFALMSRNPAIGKRFMEKYKYDVFPKDFCTIDGKKFMPPRYYDKLYMRRCADGVWENYEKLKEDRKEKKKEEGMDRLMEKRKHKKEVTKTLIRRYEDGTACEDNKKGKRDG